MINWRDCIVPIRRDPPKQEKPPAKPYTNYEASTALALEARRRKQSYGQLTSATDWQEQDEIITAYMARKQGMTSKKRQQCTGCIYHKRLCNDPAASAGRMRTGCVWNTRRKSKEISNEYTSPPRCVCPYDRRTL